MADAPRNRAERRKMKPSKTEGRRKYRANLRAIRAERDALRGAVTKQAPTQPEDSPRTFRREARNSWRQAKKAALAADREAAREAGYRRLSKWRRDGQPPRRPQ